MATIDAIELKSLWHRFGHAEVLKDLSLSVPQGSFVSLVGPSGCGKSTMLQILAGLLKPSLGEATVDGTSVVGRKGHVGYMPQRDLLLPWRRAFENACIGGDVAGRNTDETRVRARELFKRFGLAGFEKAWPSQLSGGMRQRLALLRTFLIGADVLLLDEPFGALDAITRKELHSWLQDLWLSSGGSQAITALLVTHDVEEALFLSDEVHVMSNRPGQIVETLKVDEPKPRSLSAVTSEAFVENKKRLLDALAL